MNNQYADLVTYLEEWLGAISYVEEVLMSSEEERVELRAQFVKTFECEPEQGLRNALNGLTSRVQTERRNQEVLILDSLEDIEVVIQKQE